MGILTAVRRDRERPELITRTFCTKCVILEPALSSKQFRKNWARPIQKILEVDPLVYPNCNGTMQVIAFIEDSDLIKKILNVYLQQSWKYQWPEKVCDIIIHGSLISGVATAIYLLFKQ